MTLKAIGSIAGKFDSEINTVVPMLLGYEPAHGHSKAEALRAITAAAKSVDDNVIVREKRSTHRRVPIKFAVIEARREALAAIVEELRKVPNLQYINPVMDTVVERATLRHD